MSAPTNDDLQRQIEELRERVGFVEGVADGIKSAVQVFERDLNHIRERAEVKYTDHGGRLENLENVRIGFFGVIAALLFMNLGGIALIIYLQTLP